MATTRRLAAILAADVAGYSRLMGADEEGTHARLRAHFAELVHPKILEHRGRVVKNTGDGLLAEFASLVDAVRCAAGVQEGVSDRNSLIPTDERIEFRVGVNLGDIIAEGDDIFGDGVNIAARLEGLAAPGGVCVSGAVLDHIGDRLPYAFADMGEQSVKNIARPVRVYALRSDAVRDRAKSAVLGSLPISQPAAAPRLSIVVLPFANLSNDPEQQYFADGITEDLTTDLSRIAGMLVISRNTAFTYQGKQVDTKQIGRELAVRYVFQGTVRRSGSRVRLNAQLIDAETDVHLWAKRFDGDAGDLFALQNEVTSRIAVELNFEVVSADAARPTEHPDALDYILRGRAATVKPPSRETYVETVGHYERALALDPRSVEAHSWLAATLSARVLDNMADTAEADIVRAEGLAAQAVAAAPRSALAHYAKGQVLRAQRRYAEAIPEYEAVLAFNRNAAAAYYMLGQCKTYTGSIFHNTMGRAHLLQSHSDEAITCFEKARNYIPVHHPETRALLAAAYGVTNETERAASELAEARRLSADDRFLSLARLRASQYWGVPKIRALFEATYFAGLRLAGMPEE
jgi:TolB-like protein/class 3 adenylate cyclase